MTQKPIFVATHPRACSTAFERIFMTRQDILKCAHEPFGDAYYFGPERLAERYEADEKTRIESGYSNTTYQTILDIINRENPEGKRVLLKDMAQYLIPPNQKTAHIAPSLKRTKRGVGTNGTITPPRTPLPNGVHEPLTPTPTGREESKGHADGQANGYSNGHTNGSPPNPTVLPTEFLDKFHFTFLIRHPRFAIPSYYRCTVPPLDAMTGFYNFRPDEAGYDELRRLFDYLRTKGNIGPIVAGQDDDDDDAAKPVAWPSNVDICVIDADDLLDNPKRIISTFCDSVGIDFHPNMLNWETDEEQQFAQQQFEKWKGFHEDVLHSKDLKPRQHKKVKSDEQLYAEWVEKYGKEGANVIRDSVEENVADYDYLKQFAIKI